MSSIQIKPKGTKYCPDCRKQGRRTPAEWYRGSQLDHCTYHYWLMRGRKSGHYSFESYVEASKVHGFTTSFPPRAHLPAR